MSTLDSARGVAALLGAALLWLPAHAQEGPGLGVAIDAGDYASWDISIEPDGENLPPGAGDAATGEVIYAEKCAACHGGDGTGGPNDPLVGGHGTLDTLDAVRTIGSYWPYATTVFDYIRRAMPFQAPQSLTDDEVYALTAYLLAQNGVIAEDEVMNARTLPEVRMPNRDGFVLAYP